MAKAIPEAEVEHPGNNIVERINRLIMLLNIKKVYFIDDANCKDVDVEIFLGKIRFVHQQAESAEKLSSVIIEDVSYSDPFEILSENIKNKWPAFDQTKRLELLRQLNQATEDQQSVMDYEITPKIKAYFSNDVLVYVDPFEWERILNSVAENLGENEKVLLIFDQDLKNAGGKYLQQNGVDLIIQLKESALKDKAICALLTHEIALTDQELYYREQIKDNNDAIEYADFFPLSKKKVGRT